MTWKYFGHGQDVVDLAWTKNSQYIISGSMDGTVKFWSISKQRDSKNVASF
jgi:WD40 repeat protein